MRTTITLFFALMALIPTMYAQNEYEMREYQRAQEIAESAIRSNSYDAYYKAYKCLYDNLNGSLPDDGEVLFNYALLCNHLSLEMNKKAGSLTYSGNWGEVLALSSYAGTLQIWRNACAVASKIEGNEKGSLLCDALGLSSPSHITKPSQSYTPSQKSGRSRAQIEADINHRTRLLNEAIANKERDKSISEAVK